jgi:hypothetical protein
MSSAPRPGSIPTATTCIATAKAAAATGSSLHRLDRVRHQPRIEVKGRHRENLLDQRTTGQGRIGKRQRKTQAIAQAKVVAPRQRMIGNHHRTERLRCGRDDGDILLSRRVMREDEIDLVGDQSLDQFFGGADPDLKTNIWVSLLELGNRRWQQLTCHRFRGCDADLPPHKSAELLDPRFHQFQFRDHQAAIDQEDFAGGCHANAPRQTLEQGGAKIGFQIEDLAVERRRSDVERVGGFPDRPVAGNRIDVTEHPRRTKPPLPGFGGGTIRRPCRWFRDLFCGWLFSFHSAASFWGGTTGIFEGATKPDKSAKDRMLAVDPTRREMQRAVFTLTVAYFWF